MPVQPKLWIALGVLSFAVPSVVAAPDATIGSDEECPSVIRGAELKLVKAQDTVQPSANSQKTEKTDATYVLFRVGSVWYVYDKQADKELIDLTEKLEPPAPPAK